MTREKSLAVHKRITRDTLGFLLSFCLDRIMDEWSVLCIWDRKTVGGGGGERV